ncbi:MAG: circularly permuted type 2 ATP-grasp protein, partial [Actinobacteria bacterium]|nr:circularly permuted type 2 ATP-grasp protein [Actinomycetota bacterium]
MQVPFDEMFDSNGKVWPHYAIFSDWLQQQSDVQMSYKREEAELIFRRIGITFAIYGDEKGTERTIPFDQIPRIIPNQDWKILEEGLKQRVKALNLFLHDIYHDEKILKAGLIPKQQIYNNSQYRPEMRHIDVPRNIYAHIAGIDIIRAEEGKYYVLEDNLRVPSGVSYMVENRKMMMRLFPD